MKKRIMCMAILTVIMVGLLSIAASAVEPRYIECENCFKGRIILQNTTYTDWHDGGVFETCEGSGHGGGNRYNHIKQYRTVTQTYGCTFCNSGYDHVYEQVANYCAYLGRIY